MIKHSFNNATHVQSFLLQTGARMRSSLAADGAKSRP